MVQFLLRNKKQQKEGTSMDTRIAQTLENFTKKIVNVFEKDEIFELEDLESNFKRPTHEFLKGICELYIEIIDEVFISQKQERKEAEITVHKRNVSREILGSFGLIKPRRTYFKVEDQYSFLADKVVGIEPYDRVSMSVSAELVDSAAYMSYQRSAKVVTDSNISRQTVMKKIRRTKGLELIPGDTKRKVKILHIVADEDHVAMQSGKNRQVPLITVHEGILPVSKNRNRCVNARHFSDYRKSTKELWEEISAWIYAEYDLDVTERIYLHGDGASWIRQGLEILPDCRFVLDKYHIEKSVKTVLAGERKAYHFRLRKAFEIFNINEIGKITDEMLTEVGSRNEAEIIIGFKRYIFNNWDGIKIRQEEPVCGGSCTEAQISHVLAERLSRNPLGWSEEGLGYMSRLRVYKVNGENVTTKNFVRKNDENALSEMEKRVIAIAKQVFTDMRDYSIFEPQKARNGKITPINTILRGMNRAGMRI